MILNPRGHYNDDEDDNSDIWDFDRYDNGYNDDDVDNDDNDVNDDDGVVDINGDDPR